MKSNELIQKLLTSECVFSDAESTDLARSAFLANLVWAIGVELPKDCIDTKNNRDHLLFYAGVIVGLSREIPKETIQEAHLVMILPSNRAIISRLLYGPGDVNKFGVPLDYVAGSTQR